MDARSGSFFESEAENPAEAAREAVAEIGTPLALDFLREGIMHYAGVASAQIKNKLANLDPKFKEIFKGRMDELARVAKMKPEERKKWLADEVKKRRQARLQRESEDKAPDTDTADSAREGAGGDREDELGVPRPADDSTEGRRDDAAGQGAGAVPEREDVDDQGVNEQISRLRGLEPGEFNWAEEYDKIRGNIDSKAGALSRRRRDAMNKGTPDFKEPTSVDDLKYKVDDLKLKHHNPQGNNKETHSNRLLIHNHNVLNAATGSCSSDAIWRVLRNRYLNYPNLHCLTHLQVNRFDLKLLHLSPKNPIWNPLIFQSPLKPREVHNHHVNPHWQVDCHLHHQALQVGKLMFHKLKSIHLVLYRQVNKQVGQIWDRFSKMELRDYLHLI
jgi:hypothetical protein